MALLRIRKPDGEIVEIASLPGKKGDDGADGKDGLTPVKGVDYFTPAEQETFLASAKEYADEKTAPATAETYGTVRVCTDADAAGLVGGIVMRDGGALSIVPASEAAINGRTNPYTPIVPANLERAVKSVGDGYYAKVEDVGGTDVWELVEEITVSEAAVVERKYDTPFKKIIVSFRSTGKIPRARLTGGLHYWEFYYNDYGFSNVDLVGDFIAPGILADVHALFGENGSVPSRALPPINRLRCSQKRFDGFKTHSNCVAGTTIKVYGVKA